MPPLGTRMNNAVGLWRNGNFQQELCWSWMLCWKNMPPLGTPKNSAIGLWLHCRSWGFLTKRDGLQHRSPGHRGHISRENLAWYPGRIGRQVNLQNCYDLLANTL